MCRVLDDMSSGRVKGRGQANVWGEFRGISERLRGLAVEKAATEENEPVHQGVAPSEGREKRTYSRLLSLLRPPSP